MVVVSSIVFGVKNEGKVIVETVSKGLSFSFLCHFYSKYYAGDYYGLYFSHHFYTYYKLQSFTYQSWDSTKSSASTSTMYQSAHVESRLYAVFKFKLINYLFSLKNSRPCQDLKPGPPQYQADMLPTELYWLGYNINVWKVLTILLSAWKVFKINKL